jgi:hypothetical protein
VWRVGGSADDIESGLVEDSAEAFAQEHGVFGDNDA